MVFLKSSNGFLYLKNEIKGNLEKYLREILNKSTTSGCREIKWLSSEDLNGMNMPTNLDMWLHLNSIDTTMNVSSKVDQLSINNSLVHEAIISAQEQMNGTGRKNNKWLSNDGAIILTFLHKLSTNSIYQKSLINLQYAAALAVLEMIMDLFDELEIDEKIVMQIKNCIKIKWPNDIYYVEKNVDKNVYKKLGGILIRTSCTPQMNSNQYQFVINMGIGINFRNECLVETGIGLETIFKKFNVSLKDHWNEFYIYHLLFSKWQKWLNITNVKFLQESLVNNWMHRDEVFSLKKYSNESFQLIGIDEDGNLLAKMMTGEKSLIRLSSDENSLDVNESIIKPK